MIDPASLRILTYPDPALRQRAAEIAEMTEEVRSVAQRMIELMREAEGVGLAGPQVGLPWRIFVAEVPPGEERSVDSDPRTATLGAEVYVNPKIASLEGSLETNEEGCLSLPGITADIARPPIVTIESMSVEGARSTMMAGGLLARCWQHEMDHLDGVLIIDRMSQIAKIKARSALRAMEKTSR